MSLSPGADDVWLKAMSLKKGILCRQVSDIRSFEFRFLQIPFSQIVSLKRKNKKKVGGNQEKIKATLDEYNLSFPRSDLGGG